MEAKPTRHERASNLSLSLGMALVVGLAVASGTLGRRRGPRERPHEDERHSALVTYLHEHLIGADAAIRVVERLRQTQTDERPLFDRLYNEFQADRQVVQGLLTILGVSARSPKRFMGQASGAVLRRLAGGLGGRSVTVSNARSIVDRRTGQAMHVARARDPTACSAAAWNSKLR